MNLEFEAPHKWADRYQRNNKRNGLKNLRCFPHCANPHKEKGFCGCAVRVTVTRHTNEPIFAWAEFCRVDDQQSIAVGSIVKGEDMMGKERDRSHPTRPYYRGEVIDPLTNMNDDNNDDDDDEDEDDNKRRGTKKSGASSAVPGQENEPEEIAIKRRNQLVTFQFNKRKRGWNYSWAANKHTCNSVHALFVYIMVPHGPSSFRCVGVYQSPTFQVYCRKRTPKVGDSPASNNKDTPYHRIPRTDTLVVPPSSAIPQGASGGHHHHPPPPHHHHHHDHQHHQQQQSHHENQFNPGFLADALFDNFGNPDGFDLPYLFDPTLEDAEITNHPPHQEPSPVHYDYNGYQQQPQYNQQSQYNQQFNNGTNQPMQQQQGQYSFQQQQQQGYLGFYNAQPVINEFNQDESAQAEEFRRFFIESFWNDDENGLDEFNPRKRQLEGRSNSIDDPSYVRNLEVKEENGSSSSSLFDDDESGGDSNANLKPPPLKELMKREEAHRRDPDPPKEISKMFGEASDGEETLINAKVWRLVLVLALVEAHWCEVQQIKRRASSKAGVTFDPSSMFDLTNEDLDAMNPSNVFSDENDADMTNSSCDNTSNGSVSTSSQSHHDADHPHDVNKEESNTPAVGGRLKKPSPSSVAVPPGKNTLLAKRRKSESFLPRMSTDNRLIVQRLATFLIEEKTFTHAIEETLISLPSQSTMKEMKCAFIKVAHEQLGLFCEANDLSLAQFDRLFDDQPPLEFLKQAAIRLKMLQETMKQYSDTKRENVQKAPIDRQQKRTRTNIGATVSSENVLNVSGVWEMDEDLLEAHSYMREIRGVPWVLRKMIGYIEREITLEQTGYDKVHMQGKRKLLSNGGNLYITDGRLRKFNLLSPVPWSKPLAEYYKAWFAPPYFHLEHYYSDQERLCRRIIYEPYRLRFELEFQKLEDEDWVTHHSMAGYANLVKPLDDFNANTHGGFQQK